MRLGSARGRFLLDTDVLINILRHIPGYSSLPYQQSFIFYYASISKKELYSKRGLKKSEAQAIAKLLTRMRQVNLDDRILECYDILLSKYRPRGLFKADALTAATAWAKDLRLVTSNISDFAFIE